MQDHEKYLVWKHLAERAKAEGNLTQYAKASAALDVYRAPTRREKAAARSRFDSLALPVKFAPICVSCVLRSKGLLPCV